WPHYITPIHNSSEVAPTTVATKGTFCQGLRGVDSPVQTADIALPEEGETAHDRVCGVRTKEVPHHQERGLRQRRERLLTEGEVVHAVFVKPVDAARRQVRGQVITKIHCPA